MLVGFLVSVTVLTAACTKKAVTLDEKQPATVETEETKLPAPADTEEIEQLAAVEADEKEQSATAETEEIEQLAAAEADEKEQPATAETEEIEQLAAAEAEKKEQPATAETEEKEQPAAVETEEKEQPAAVEAEEKRLKATLELWDGQDGIVGMLGHVWTIEPSGAWRVTNFVNDEISETLHEGQLTPEELAFLIELLESQTFDELPSRLHVGDLLAVYARMITLNLVDLKETTLFFEAGERLQRPSSVQLRITLARFVKIANTIKQLTNGGYARAEADPGTINLAAGE
jgi:chemotaxis protein histidine kinase CheA